MLRHSFSVHPIRNLRGIMHAAAAAQMILTDVEPTKQIYRIIVGPSVGHGLPHKINHAFTSPVCCINIGHIKYFLVLVNDRTAALNISDMRTLY